MAKLLCVDGHYADVGVRDRKEAEEIIFQILHTYSEWLAGCLGGPAEEYHKGLVEQFSGDQDLYAYELPLTELRRTGKLGEWTPQPLRLYVRKSWDPDEGFPLTIQIRDNGNWDAAPEWVPPELR